MAEETRPLPTLVFLSTGQVRMRCAMRGQPASNYLRLARSFADRAWTAWLPIGVFLIRHADGPILFDTGESPHCNDAGYRPAYAPGRLLAETQIASGDGIVDLLRQHGVAPPDLQAIVLSHLHGDHAGGLPALVAAAPDVPIYVSRVHWQSYGLHPLYASIQGCTPKHWPASFAPRLLDFESEEKDKKENNALGPWPQTLALTADRSVLAVPTPGHVPGHISLVVRGAHEDGTPTTYLLAGDATYGMDVLDQERPDGINSDPRGALDSLRRIKALARQQDVVVLPSHDTSTPRLLRERVVYRPTGE